MFGSVKYYELDLNKQKLFCLLLIQVVRESSLSGIQTLDAKFADYNELR